ncbi:FecR family protein [Persicitalea sp.]|uniref:FecR family protein n=1 Tax=Persicitalea sp. TaxID=3100273 RepID=UPI003593AB38
MSRTAFAILLKKYQNGDATAAECQVVEQWYALLDEEPRSLTVHERKEIEERLWRALQEASLGREVRSLASNLPFWRGNIFKLGVAAAVGLMMLFSYQSYRSTVSKKQTSAPIAQQMVEEMKTIVNNSAGKISVVFEDSSRALLSVGSELKYPDHFTAKVREVHLSGEAFFEVSENPERPFLVNAGQITTRVLGTSFLVNAPADQASVEVSVRTGKVSVYESDRGTNKIGPSSKKGNGVVLAANHRVRFSAKDKLFLTSLVEKPVPLPETGTEVNFDFDDSPLIEVLQRLEAGYSIKIEMEKKSLGVCPLTARLSGLELYDQLDIICAAIQGTYDVKGTTILISGQGCDSNF